MSNEANKISQPRAHVQIYIIYYLFISDLEWPTHWCSQLWTAPNFGQTGKALSQVRAAVFGSAGLGTKKKRQKWIWRPWKKAKLHLYRQSYQISKAHKSWSQTSKSWNSKLLWLKRSCFTFSCRMSIKAVSPASRPKVTALLDHCCWCTDRLEAVGGICFILDVLRAWNPSIYQHMFKPTHTRFQWFLGCWRLGSSLCLCNRFFVSIKTNDNMWKRAKNNESCFLGLGHVCCDM